MQYEIPNPFDLKNLEDSKRVLKTLVAAKSSLAELKAVSKSIPDAEILIRCLILQEAKESSEIENIITTHDDLYQSTYEEKVYKSIAVKEVHQYAEALRCGSNAVKTYEFISQNIIQDVQQILEENQAGYRKQAGTTLKSDRTGEVVYIPPQNHSEIEQKMNLLERYINEYEGDLDPLVRMAVIHHQFESIHPFYDGNGRTGRILNILFLINEGLLEHPVLYLSGYINRNKQEYYRLLQFVRETSHWEDWIVFMLEIIRLTALSTTSLVNEIKSLMIEFKVRLKMGESKIYSHELINNLFRHPYTKIDFLARELKVHRNTARTYLEKLIKMNLLKKVKVGKENFYINTRLFDLLQNMKYE